MKTFDPELIREYARRIKLPTALVEKDYILSVVLQYLSKFSEQLVFKGGTALRKVYFPDYRFSSDLDFNANSSDKESIAKYIGKLTNKKLEGASFLRLLDKSQKQFNHLILVLKYDCKIGTTPGKEHVDNIKIDFNFDSEVVLGPEKRTIVSPEEFSLEQFEINAMKIEEIICEKINAIYKRSKPRDLYDFNCLLKKGYEINIDLANKKLEPLGVKYKTEEFIKQLDKFRPRWKNDMHGLLPKTPSFEEVFEETKRLMKKRPNNSKPETQD